MKQVYPHDIRMSHEASAGAIITRILTPVGASALLLETSFTSLMNCRMTRNRIEYTVLQHLFF